MTNQGFSVSSITKKESLQLKREVKAQTKHNLNKIEIDGYTDTHIYYLIYQNIFSVRILEKSGVIIRT